MSDKKVILTVGNVRVKQYDSMNVVVERYEDVFIPKDKQTIKKWVFKGYSRNILSAVLFIQRKELLLNENEISNLDDHLEQVKQSNKQLVEAIGEVK